MTRARPQGGRIRTNTQKKKGVTMTTHRSYTAARRPVRYVIRREPATRAELLAGGWTEDQIHEFAWPRVVHAYAIAPDGSEQLVRHHVRHSPTGFEFGYHGSGPAELARCLLIDYFDLHEHADEDLPLPVSYQEFKRDFIGRLSRDAREHAIDVETIGAWVRAHSATRRT